MKKLGRENDLRSLAGVKPKEAAKQFHTAAACLTQAASG